MKQDNPLTFVSAQQHHKDTLKDISRRVIRNCYTVFLGDALVDGFLSSGAADAEIDEGFSSCTVAIAEEEIVGFFIVKDLLLHLIMVDIPYQRSGYGMQIMHYAEQQIAAQYDEIKLQSFVQNTAAQAFYLKCGYAVQSEFMDADIGQRMAIFQKNLR